MCRSAGLLSVHAEHDGVPGRVAPAPVARQSAVGNRQSTYSPLSALKRVRFWEKSKRNIGKKPNFRNIEAINLLDLSHLLASFALFHPRSSSATDLCMIAPDFAPPLSAARGRLQTGCLRPGPTARGLWLLPKGESDKASPSETGSHCSFVSTQASTYCPFCQVISEK